VILRSDVFCLSFPITFLLALFLASRIDQPVPGATSIKLIAGCWLDFLDTRLQPVFTVALACPREDYIRLWPLPIKQPWSEDPAVPERLKKLHEAFQKPSLPMIVIQ
jgi:hypothetical protein